MKKLLSLLLGYWVLNPVFGQKTEVLVMPKELWSMAGYAVYWFTDSTRQLTIQEVSDSLFREKFVRNTRLRTAKDPAPVKHWLRLSIKNDSPEKIWLNVEMNMVRTIDYYAIPENEKNYRLLAQVGSLRPDSNKPYQASNTYWLPLKVRKGETETIYLCADGEMGLPALLTVGILPKLHEKKTEKDLIIGAFLGLVFIMIGYNFFLYLSVKDRVYLTYSAYLFVMFWSLPYINHYEIVNVFFPAAWKTTINEYFIIWYNGTFAIITIFTQQFLKLKQNLPKLNNYLHFYLFGIIVILPMLIVFRIVPTYVAFLLLQLNVPHSAVFLLGAGLYLWGRKNYKIARLYVLGWAWLLLSVMAFMLYMSGILPHHLLIENSVIIGTSLEILFFSLALGDRINAMRSENIRLVKEQNSILEKKVSERTQEINQKKEEIQTQAEELRDTHDALQEAYQEIQIKNQDIIASINYALRIQNAILPKESVLQNYWDCFVFFRPRDIVSGDFYWFAEKVISGQGSVMSEKMPLQTTDHRSRITILAVADCTGHGVSGALMTMIGNNILNQLVHNNGIYEPDEILNQMPPLLEKTLSHSEGSIGDGMDIAILCSKQKNTPSSENTRLTVSYAGAMNPLYYIENQRFKEIKADKIPIGGQRKKGFQYKKHEILFDAEFLISDEGNPTSKSQNLTFYLCSDGFQDQFGGEENRKFMSRRFKDLLFEISNNPMSEQKKYLEKIFEEWQGIEKQTDDVLVIGIRI